MADKKRILEAQHRKRSFDYYHANRDKVLNRIKAKNLEKRKINTKKKLEQIEKQENNADNKKIKEIKAKK